MDAQTFADWGVDYLKEDSCFSISGRKEALAQYRRMRDALNQTGRHIFFSLCGWHAWYAQSGRELGNSWRIGGDVGDFPSLYNAIRSSELLDQYAGPGGWNDPDMLVGSSPGASIQLTPTQSRMQFSMWAILAAPLLLGTRPSLMTSWDLETYSNTDVISVSQDALGVQGSLLLSDCHQQGPHIRKKVPDCAQVWGRPLADGNFALCMVNFGARPRDVVCNADCLAKLQMTLGEEKRDSRSTRPGSARAGAAKVDRSLGLAFGMGFMARDLWSR